MNLKNQEKIELLKMEDSIPIDEILKAIKSIKYGYVQIIIQDGKVVQIDKTEKIRFNKSR